MLMGRWDPHPRAPPMHVGSRTAAPASQIAAPIYAHFFYAIAGPGRARALVSSETTALHQLISGLFLRLRLSFRLFKRERSAARLRRPLGSLTRLGRLASCWTRSPKFDVAGPRIHKVCGCVSRKRALAQLSIISRLAHCEIRCDVTDLKTRQRVAYRIKTERRRASRLSAFFAADLCNRRGVFLLPALELFIAGSAAFKSRRRKTTRQIVRRGKLYGFRVVNHARPIAELISVPLTDDHLDL